VGKDLATIKLQAKKLKIKKNYLGHFQTKADGEIFHDSLSPIGP
jgi:hypothetical protein